MSDSLSSSSVETNRQLLLIAYYYYQDESPASKRTKGLCRYLPEYGWDVTLLTVPKYSNQQNTTNIIHAEMKKDFVQKFVSQLCHSNSLNECHNDGCEERNSCKHPLLSLGKRVLNNKYTGCVVRRLYHILFSQYDGAGWFKPAVNVGRQELYKKKYDAILSTQCPITAHCIAHELKKEFDVPWIADYRDLWSQWDLVQKGKSPRRKEKDYQFECGLIEYANVLTVVSEPWALELEKQHGKPVVTIPNGFDPEIQNPGMAVDAKFSILHSGVIYGRNRSLKHLFHAVRELVDDGMGAHVISPGGPRDFPWGTT